MLSAMGFSKDAIEAANEHVCGTMTVEGAPNLKDEHLPSSIAPTLAAGKAPVSCRRQPHQDAGGSTAVHLWRDLQNDQHAERCVD